jgi:hypothetical protein
MFPEIFFQMIINLDIICDKISIGFILTISTTISSTSLFANRYIHTFLQQLSQYQVGDRKGVFLNYHLFVPLYDNLGQKSYSVIFFLFC